MKEAPLRGVIHVEIYCPDEDCPGRESEVKVKLHSAEDHQQLEAAKWNCPVCGKPCKVHWQRSSSEYQREELKRSIAMVNAALYERDAQRETGRDDLPVAVPLTAFIKTLPEDWRPVSEEDLEAHKG